MSFCRDVLNGAGVAITPGLDFDEGRGARTVRLSFAGSLGECEEAVARMGAWLRQRA
jgi:aspartate/methionine/tyrosine aminotransferase